MTPVFSGVASLTLRLDYLNSIKVKCHSVLPCGYWLSIILFIVVIFIIILFIVVIFILIIFFVIIFIIVLFLILFLIFSIR